MTVAYVSRDEQKAYSRIQHTALDDTIDLLIMACSAGVKNYMNDFSPYEGERNDDDDYVVDSNYEPEPKLDSNGAQVVRPEVKAAVLYWVDQHLKRKESADAAGYPPSVVVQLLYSLRDPVIR